MVDGWIVCTWRVNSHKTSQEFCIDVQFVFPSNSHDVYETGLSWCHVWAVQNVSIRVIKANGTFFWSAISSRPNQMVLLYANIDILPYNIYRYI